MSKSDTNIFILEHFFTKIPTNIVVSFRSVVLNFVFENRNTPRSAFSFLHEAFNFHFDEIKFAFFCALDNYVFIFEETKSLRTKVVHAFVSRIVPTPPFVETLQLDHLTTVKFRNCVWTGTNKFTIHFFRFRYVAVNVLRNDCQTSS
ncbi:hypothetical protein D3C72_1662400 [compost metagenome]